jgi:cell division protein FtsL
MTPVNLILAAVLAASALGVVAARHKARELYVALSHEQDRARELDVEFGRLQLEQSTWAMHSRIEKIASGRLGMSVPDAHRMQAVSRMPPPETAPVRSAP